ncbi:MAG: ECF transporter S component, partial [Clostridia bacterium]|nr:ECF transporter S component [Clostridia bacterium]
MKTENKRRMSTKTVALGAIMTAIVIVVQYLATYTAFFGPFSTAVALIPIVIGAALCGVGVGAWLGLIFGIVVLVTGGAALFFMFSVPGTVITVLLKGTMCGLVAGLVYKFLRRYNLTVAA